MNDEASAHSGRDAGSDRGADAEQEATPANEPQDGPASADPVALADVENTPVQDLGSVLEGHLRDGTVDVWLVVRVNSWRSTRLNQDLERRAVAERYYSALLAAVRKSDPNGQFAIYGTNIRGAVVWPGDQSAEMWLLVDQGTLGFDWTEARDLLSRLNKLDADIRGLLDPADAKQQRGGIYSEATHVLAALDEEASHHAFPSPGRRGEPTGAFVRDMENLSGSVADGERAFLDAAQSVAQVQYAIGMAFGAGSVAVIAAVVAGILWWQDVPAVNAVSGLTGAAGALVSVMRRMQSGKLELDVRAPKHMLRVFGGFRPVLGAVFGLIVYLLLRAKLIPAVELPTPGPQELAFVAAVGFLAGFSERFADDVLAGVERRFT